jgi:hypothetical protein
MALPHAPVYGLQQHRANTHGSSPRAVRSIVDCGNSSTAKHDCAGSYLPGLHVRLIWVGKDLSKAGSLWCGPVETTQGHPLISRFSCSACDAILHVTALPQLARHRCREPPSSSPTSCLWAMRSLPRRLGYLSIAPLAQNGRCYIALHDHSTPIAATNASPKTRPQKTRLSEVHPTAIILA